MTTFYIFSPPVEPLSFRVLYGTIETGFHKHFGVLTQTLLADVTNSNCSRHASLQPNHG